MKQREIEVAVVGAGVMGLASAWALARAGRDVVVLEQFHVGHLHGSSHGYSRIFRFAYDDPWWVELAQEALPLWRELEAESNEELLSLTGLLEAREDSEPLRAALETRGAEYELLDTQEAAQRFGIELDGELVLELHGGIVRAARALEAFRRKLSIHEGVRVLELAASDNGARVETSAGPVDAQVAVIAGGAWASPLLHRAGVELETTVTRETVVYFRVPGAHELPSVIDWSEDTGRHAYSLAAGENLLKVGLHHAGAPVDPDEPGRPDPTVVEAASEWVRRRYPPADSEPTGAETCLYTNSEDDRFVLERHGPIVVCSACSGHGFKFAPVVGTRVAGLAAA